MLEIEEIQKIQRRKQMQKAFPIPKVLASHTISSPQQP
jgi:hypothetical protein